jgi:hypothetical protein
MLSACSVVAARTVAARRLLSSSIQLTHRSSLGRALPALAALLASASVQQAAADNVRGAWSAPAPWPLIAIHAVLTPDGRVLTYGTDGNGTQTGYFIYDVWDPIAGPGAGHVTLSNVTGTDIFCSAQIVLPQSGNILLAGGDNFVNGKTTNTGNNNTNIFTPANNNLARGNNMNRPRWYATSTTLVNGEIYIQGGTSGRDRPEVRQSNGVFRLLSGADTFGFSELYPRNWVGPDGRVFGFDVAGLMYFVVPSGTGSITSAGQLPGSTSWTSSAVMFRPGRILQIGGASNAARVVDINGPAPVVADTQAMMSQRQWVTATVLADGRVVATGGSAANNSLPTANNTAELWNPDNGTWTQGTAGTNARLYHSAALLLPDARVLVGGGGAPGPLVNLNVEIYTPPYLFNGHGNLASRPTIVSAPDTLDIGQNFAVGFGNASSISRVTLVKTGSVTHSFNMDQRFLELSFTATGAMLDVQMPTRASDATPGYYMLFVLNAQGIPSTAKIVRVNIASNPNTSPDYTPAIGGAGGTPFTLACTNNEVVAGVYGTSAGTYVNQAGIQCVRVDQTGHWVGTPINRGIAGVASGSAYTKTCPVNFAVSGFRGRASQYVDQLDFSCRPLTDQGKLTGVGLFLGPIGGSAGTAQGPFSCGTNNPVYALYGRSSSWLDNLGVQCRAPDFSAPTTPGGLTAWAASSTQINLSWTVSADNVGVTGYRIERCQGPGCTSFALVTTVTATTYNNTGLIASTKYTYRVRATDAASNLSGYSNTATARTRQPK